MEKCFALKKRGCAALLDDCPGSDRCPFYKTKKEFKQGQADAFTRLSNLPPEEQRYISEKYYNGKMPWADDPH